jgi:hypothetical protein
VEKNKTYEKKKEDTMPGITYTEIAKEGLVKLFNLRQSCAKRSVNSIAPQILCKMLEHGVESKTWIN